jgi:hypothetical protein
MTISITDLDIKKELDDDGNPICWICKKQHGIWEMILMGQNNLPNNAVRVCVPCTIRLGEEDGVYDDKSVTYVRISVTKLRDYEKDQKFLEYILEHKREPDDFNKEHSAY